MQSSISQHLLAVGCHRHTAERRGLLKQLRCQNVCIHVHLYITAKAASISATAHECVRAIWQLLF